MLNQAAKAKRLVRNQSKILFSAHYNVTQVLSVPASPQARANQFNLTRQQVSNNPIIIVVSILIGSKSRHSGPLV